MPQFNPAWFASQVFWLVVSFGMLYGLIAYVIIPRITSVLDERARSIKSDLARANAARREASELEREAEVMREEARGKARAILSKARREIAADQAHREAAFVKRLDDATRAAEQRIATARFQAYKESEAIAVELAQLLSERIISTKLSAQAAKRAVANVVREREEHVS